MDKTTSSKLIASQSYLWLRRLVLAFLIVSAVLIGGGRLLLPMVADYRPEIEQLAGEAVGAPVSIKKIETSWHGLLPVLSLRDVDISNLTDQGDSLHLKSLDFSISIFSSLLAWEVRPAQISLAMSELNVVQLPDGSYNFRLIDEDSPEIDLLDDKTLQWVLQQPDLNILIHRFSFEDRKNNFPQVSVSELRLVFSKESADIVVSISAASTNLSSSVKAVVRVRERKEADAFPAIDLYTKLDQVNLSRFQKIKTQLINFPQSGYVNMALWVSLDQGRLRLLEGQLSTSDIVLGGVEGQRPSYELSSFQTGFKWEKLQTGWDLLLTDLQFDRNDKKWPNARLAVNLRQQADGWQYLINSSYLSLEDILPLVWHQPAVPAEISDRLREMSPSGQLSDLKLQFTYNNGAISRYGLQTDIRGLFIRASGDVPGVSGIGGNLAATEQAGFLRLDAQNATLDLPGLFREPLPLDLAKGVLSWSKVDKGWLLETADVQIENAHIKTRSRLSIHWPATGSPLVDLQTNFQNADGTHTSRYLPASVLSKFTLAWLDKGIVAGHVEYGSFVLYGALEDFPFDDNNGKFEVRFKLRDGILDYYENWPVIDEIEAEVAFVGREMHITATAGKIFESDIRSAIVHIDDLEADNPKLRIRGKMQVRSTDLMRYLNETKLAGDYEQALSFMSLEGQHAMDLNLNIPLSEGDVGFDGKLKFQKNRLDVASWKVALENITGSLSFDQDSFSADNIKASFAGQPTTISVSTVEASQGRETHIQANSDADLSRLLPKGKSRLSEILSGMSPVEIDIVVPDYPQGRSSLTASSTLEGTAIKLPQPLGKTARQVMPLTVTAGFMGDAAQTIDITLGDKLQATLAVDKQNGGLSGAALLFGKPVGGSLYQQAKDRYFIGGQLDSVSIDDWMERLNNLPANKSGKNIPIVTDFSVGKMSYGQWYVRDVTVKGSQRQGSRVVTLAGEENSGQITFPQNKNQPIMAKLSRLSLYKDDIESPEEAPEEIHTTLKPDDIPAIRLEIEDLRYQSRQLGSLNAVVETQDNKLSLNGLVLKNAQSETRITGSWIYDADEDTHLTSAQLALESEDFGDLLTRYGYADSVKEGKAKITADVSLPAALPDFDKGKLSGTVDLEIKKGEIIEIDPGSAGRVFGLLSFQALPRRLTLDFTDLFSKGMSFDEIDGSFTLSDGEAYTNNLEMKATSSKVEISGRIGLAGEDYDQLVKVIPKVSSTLPLAGALAGGPGLAVVMYLTHKLLKDPINKLTELEYQISGPWSDPVVTKLDADIVNHTAAAAAIDTESADVDPLLDSSTDPL